MPELLGIPLDEKNSHIVTEVAMSRGLEIKFQKKTPQEKGDVSAQPSQRASQLRPQNPPLSLRSKVSAFLKPLKLLTELALFPPEDFGHHRRAQISVTAG